MASPDLVSYIIEIISLFYFNCREETKFQMKVKIDEYLGRSNKNWTYN